MGTELIRAGQLVVGDQVVESEDGTLLEVERVERHGADVRITFARGIWIMPVDPQTVRATARVRVFRAEWTS